MNFLSKNLSKFKLITFDITDTLLKFKLSPAIQYETIAKNFGYSVDNEKLTKHFSLQFKLMSKNYPNFGKNSELTWFTWWQTLVINIFNAAETNINQTDLKKIANCLIEKYKTSDCWCKLIGADELIKKIKNENKCVGVISNFDPRLEIILENMNLPKFDFILNSYDVGYQKPNPKIFEYALKKANCYSNEALHIGNLPDKDYIAARNAGWSSILITTNVKDLMKFSDINQRHVFKSLQDLLVHMENTKDFLQ